jgi:hypothetical protein
VDKPTHENSCEITEDDDMGRGSIVFFSQATMRTGPLTGYDTWKKASEAGVNTKVDVESDVRAAFQKGLIMCPVPQDIVDEIGDRKPTPSDFGL